MATNVVRGSLCNNSRAGIYDHPGRAWLKRLNKSPSEILTECEMFKLCEGLKKIFINESNVISVQAPVMVCGDIHGQYEDLLDLFAVGKPVPQSRYVFLGDYVDRGRQSVEVIQLLFILKFCYPDHIYLIRGNHESRHITRIYGFYDECQTKYGNALVWTYCTDVFDYLSLAVSIENEVFGVHGGLSPGFTLVDQLQIIDRFSGLDSAGIIEDLVWSDPEDLEGWDANSRGAGHIFGRNIVRQFNNLNDFDLIVRSHQLVMAGYQFKFLPEKSLVTVWSAPNYCNRCGNKAAILEFDINMKRAFIVFNDGNNSDENNSVDLKYFDR